MRGDGLGVGDVGEVPYRALAGGYEASCDDVSGKIGKFESNLVVRYTLAEQIE